MSQDQLHGTPATAPEQPSAAKTEASEREQVADKAVVQTFLHRAEQRGQEAIDAGKQKAVNTAESVKGAVTGAVRGAKQAVTGARDRVVETAQDAKQAVVEKRDQVVGAVRDAKDATVQRVQEARGSVRGFFERAKAGVRATIDAARTKVSSTVDAAKQRTTEFFGGVRDAVVSAGTKAGRVAMDTTLTTVGVAYITGKKAVELGGRAVDATKDAAGRVVEGAKEKIADARDAAGRVVEGAKEKVADAKAFVVSDAQETLKDMKAVANGTVRAGVIAVGTTAMALEAVAKLPGKAKEKFFQLAASIRDSAVEKKDRLVELSGAAVQRVNEAAGFLAKQPANARRGFFALLAGAAEKLRQGATNAAERAHQAHEASRDAYHAKANEVIAKTQKNESKIRGMVGKFTSTKDAPSTERAETPDAPESAESTDKPEEEAFTTPEQIAEVMGSVNSIEDFVASFDLVGTVRYSSGVLADMRECRGMVMSAARYLQDKLPYIAPEDRAARIQLALAPIRNSFPRNGGMRAKLEEVFTKTFNPPEAPETPQSASPEMQSA